MEGFAPASLSLPLRSAPAFQCGKGESTRTKLPILGSNQESLPVQSRAGLPIPPMGIEFTACARRGSNPHALTGTGV